MNEASNTSNTPKKSTYVTLVFAVLALAFVVTSFENPLNILQPTVISLGSHSIKLPEFRTLFAQELMFMRDQDLDSSQQAPAVLKKILHNELVNLEVKHMGLKVSQKAAKDSLRKNPYFLNEKGDFDEKRFQTFLTASGLSLVQMVKQEQKRLGRKRLKEALLAQVTPPHALVQLAALGAFQERKGAYKIFSLIPENKDKLASLGAPSAQELKTLFEKSMPKAPEYRTYQILEVTPELFAAHTSNAPSQNAPQTGAPGLSPTQEKFERLTVQIEDDLGAGKSLEEIAHQHGLDRLPGCFHSVTTDSKGRTPQGAGATWLHKKEPWVKASLEQVFLLSPDQGPKLLQFPPSRLVLIQVKQIAPEKPLTLQEAKPQLEQAWRREKYQEKALQEAEKFLKHSDLAQMTLLPPLSANQQEGPTPHAVREALFQLSPGKSVIVKDPKKIYVVRLLSAKAPRTPQTELVKGLVKDTLQHVFWDAYLSSLKHKYPIHFNEDQLTKFFQRASR